MARSKEYITGIAISPRTICCAQCIPENRLITNISIQPVAVATAQFWSAVNSAVRELVANPEVKLAGEQVVSALPADQAVVKKISLDSEESDVAGAIEWELGQQLVGGIDDYVFDYTPCVLQPGGLEKRYLAVGYRRESVQKLKTILTSVKMVPLVIDLDIFALINVFEFNYRDILDRPALIAFTDEMKTRLILQQGGDFIDVEMIDHDQDPVEAEMYALQIRSAAATMAMSNPDVGLVESTPVFLTGASFSDEGFLRSVQQQLAGSEVLLPFREITCSAGMKEDDLLHYAPQLAVAVGLALRESD